MIEEEKMVKILILQIILLTSMSQLLMLEKLSVFVDIEV